MTQIECSIRHNTTERDDDRYSVNIVFRIYAFGVVGFTRWRHFLRLNMGLSVDLSLVYINANIEILYNEDIHFRSMTARGGARGDKSI